jgi:predicted O-methyltransferase YrrM
MPRTFRHWTPRYVVHRLALAAYERRAPSAPWITREACAYLGAWLRPEHVGIEWGSGRSTLWFARRVSRLISIEHDPQWHRLVTAGLDASGATHVANYLIALERLSAAGRPSYVEAPCGEIKLADFALVDGQYRDQCARLAMELLRPGGLLIIDNAEQFFPHPSHSPSAMVRTGAAPSRLWEELRGQLAAWHCRWTSNGVFDTAIFTKPTR